MDGGGIMRAAVAGDGQPLALTFPASYATQKHCLSAAKWMLLSSCVQLTAMLLGGYQQICWPACKVLGFHDSHSCDNWQYSLVTTLLLERNFSVSTACPL